MASEVILQAILYFLAGIGTGALAAYIVNALTKR